MTRDYDVLLPGGYCCDLIFTGLPHMPQLGSEIYSSGFDMLPGGAFTTALALHRLELRVGWACDFGNDFFSQFVLDATRREGLNNSLFRLHDQPLRTVTASLSFPHERAFVSFMDDGLPYSLIEMVAHHRPRSLLLPHLCFGPEHIALISAAHAADALVYMDCQCTGATLDTPEVADALQAVDVFAPNASEAMQLTGTADAKAALAQLAQWTPLVIIKLGAGGALAQRGSQIVHVPSLPVDVFDTTGAGDCFNAGFLYGWLCGAPLETCLGYGNICGGLSTTARGSAATPSAAQAEEWRRRMR